MTVGERIKLKREDLGLSQGDLAKRMGVSRQAISKAELHGDNITTDKVSKFANALGVTPGFLMGWTTEGNDLVEKIKEQHPGISLKEAGKRDFELLHKIHSLNASNYQLLINMIDTMLKNQQ